MKTCRKCGEQFEDAISFCPRDGEVLSDDHSAMIGRVLDGQYEVEEFIAEGGMGAVFRARHTLLGDKVAIKILPPEMRRNPEWLRRFQREGQAARRFHHPNSVIVHDLRTSSEGEIYLVMEFVEGHTLDDEVAARGGRLSPAEAMRIIEPIAGVLDAAHAQGVVHRDLKPSNIMINNRGTVKLLDLGLAKLSDMGAGASPLTVTGQLVGTPYYMSPEQWGELPRDGGEEVDGRTDVYSLGVVIYKITSGELPFKGDSAIALRRAHCHQTPRPLAEIAGNVPAAWSEAVLRAMSKDRGDRQATAGRLANELREALTGAGSNADNTFQAARTILINPGQDSGYRTPQNLNAPTVNVQGAYQSAPQALPAHTQAASQPSMQTPGRRRSFLPAAIIAVAGILILAVGGYALWRWSAGRNQNRRAGRQVENSTGSVGEDGAGRTDNPGARKIETEPAAGGSESGSTDGAFMRYHLLLGASLLDTPTRSSGSEAVKAGQTVQFVFRAGESGYIYMLGHDAAGSPVVIPLGDTTAAAEVSAGSETQAPSLPFIRLDAASGTESFTVIFSEKPLTFPFAGDTLPLDGSFRKLTAEERASVDELRREAAQGSVEFEGGEADGSAAVHLGEARGSRPVVFDINIKLKRS